MRKLSAIVGVALVAVVAATTTPLMLKAQNGGQNGNLGGVNQGGPQGEDMPHRTARAFAPFVRAIVMRRPNTAQGIFKVRRSVENSLEQADTVRILARFQKPDQMDLNLVGGRMLGQNIGVLFFTVATQDGPVAFKIYYYGYEQDMNIARIDIVDDWDDIEQMAASVETLPAPITVALNGQIGGDQQ